MTTTGSYPAFFFFVVLWHHERQGRGRKFRWVWEHEKPAVHSIWPTWKTAGSGAVVYIFFASVCLRVTVSAAVNTCTVRSGQVKGEEGCTEPGDHERWCNGGGDGCPSSVVVLGQVQGAQVAKAQPHALHVEAVGLPLLALQQVFDPVGSLLLKGNQLLFNLQEHRKDRFSLLMYLFYFSCSWAGSTVNTVVMYVMFKENLCNSIKYTCWHILGGGLPQVIHK